MSIEENLISLKMFGSLNFYKNNSCEQNDLELYISSLLKAEIERRKSNSIKKRLRFASFTIDREWEQINHKINPDINFKKIQQYSDGNFIKTNKNLCFIGIPGLGKTHCLVSIGKSLCRLGISVKSYTASDLVNELEDAQRNGTLAKMMKKIMMPRFLIIDELGFIPLTEGRARLLFDVFSKRYENGSIGVSTNLGFPKWSQLFGSIELAQALLDRFTHRCDIYVFKGESVRLLESKENFNK